MRQSSWSVEQRQAAIDLAVEVGKAEAARRLGIPPGTVGSWLHRAGLHEVTPGAVERMAPAIEQRQANVADRKARLAERMLTEAEDMLGQLRESSIEKVVKVVSKGTAFGSETEVVEVCYDRPPTADQKRIVEAVAILVDKIQLLTGEATARTETTLAGEPARAALTATVLRLAERSAA